MTKASQSLYPDWVERYVAKRQKAERGTIILFTGNINAMVSMAALSTAAYLDPTFTIEHAAISLDRIEGFKFEELNLRQSLVINVVAIANPQTYWTAFYKMLDRLLQTIRKKQLTVILYGGRSSHVPVSIRNLVDIHFHNEDAKELTLGFYGEMLESGMNTFKTVVFPPPSTEIIEAYQEKFSEFLDETWRERKAKLDAWEKGRRGRPRKTPDEKGEK